MQDKLEMNFRGNVSPKLPFLHTKMNKIVKILLHALVVLLLTMLTQVGGVIWLLYLAIASKVRIFFMGKKIAQHPFVRSRIGRFALHFLGFFALYVGLTLFIVPPLSKFGGRTPLALKATDDFPIKPNNRLFCLANRHYVTPHMYATLKDIATELKTTHPNFQIVYLDANFPFFDGFPLLPHLSHNDGKKLDIAFIYKQLKTNKVTFGKSISNLGYGICELPRKNEHNQAAACTKQGFWQYNILQKINPHKKRKTTLDEVHTKQLIQKIIQHKNVKKIFLEPHLKKRLGLQNKSKIRFHGCHAVRHDDHIHIEI